MSNFYFTHGYDSQFHGGWTVIDAENVNQAIALYRVFHPDKHPPTIDCCSIYGESNFKFSRCYQSGNFGKRAVERISVTRIIADNKAEEELIE